ncbi:hypothetical protein [Microbacterium aurum]
MPVFSADPARIDVALVHRWLSEESYWAKGRPRATQDVAMAGSRNYGVYDEATGAQLAYARVVTDGALFAWLCDVFGLFGHPVGSGDESASGEEHSDSSMCVKSALRHGSVDDRSVGRGSA